MLEAELCPPLGSGTFGSVVYVALAELERFCDNEHDWIQQHRTQRAADRLELMLHGYHVRVSRVISVVVARTVPGVDRHAFHRNSSLCLFLCVCDCMPELETKLFQCRCKSK